jgi:cation diffusion facilitator family transporter
MIDRWLDRFLGKDGERPAPDARFRLIRSAGLAGIFANALFAAVKLLIGLAANSISIMSDAVNNLTDALSSVKTLVGLKLSRRPPDYKHPLGYGRIEYLTGMVIAALVLVTGVEFLKTSAERIADPEPTDFVTAQFIVLGVAIVGKWILSRVNIVIGKRTDSDSLIAAGVDAKMDVLASIATVAAAIVSKLTGWHIDGYVGAALSLFIIYNGVSLIRGIVSSIIGERPDKELAEKLKAETLKFEPIIGAYDLILHSYGPTTKLGSLNLEIPDHVTVEKAYEAMTAAQHDIYEAYGIYFTFGLYAVNTYDKEVVALREAVSRIVAGLPGAVSMHNFNYDKVHQQFRFDVVVDFATRDFAAFRVAATAAVRKEYPGSTVVMNIDLDYA